MESTTPHDQTVFPLFRSRKARTLIVGGVLSPIEQSSTDVLTWLPTPAA